MRVALLMIGFPAAIVRYQLRVFRRVDVSDPENLELHVDSSPLVRLREI
jgi:hypothetical protein